MAQSRKRRNRRKKKKKIDDKSTNGVIDDEQKGECVGTAFQPTLELLDVKSPTSTLSVMTHSETTLSSACVDDSSRNGRGRSRLFAHSEGDSGEKESTCLSKLSRCEKLKAKRRQALRGGSSHCCYDKRMTRRQLSHAASKYSDKRKKTELKQHQFSNSHVSMTLMGRSVSNSVSKQRTVCEEGLKGRQVSLPSSVGDAKLEVAQSDGGSKTDGEATLRHKRWSRRRKRIARSRNGRRITQVCRTLCWLLSNLVSCRVLPTLVLEVVCPNHPSAILTTTWATFTTTTHLLTVILNQLLLTKHCHHSDHPWQNPVIRTESCTCAACIYTSTVGSELGVEQEWDIPKCFSALCSFLRGVSAESLFILGTATVRLHVHVWIG